METNETTTDLACCADCAGSKNVLNTLAVYATVFVAGAITSKAIDAWKSRKSTKTATTEE